MFCMSVSRKINIFFNIINVGEFQKSYCKVEQNRNGGVLNYFVEEYVSKSKYHDVDAVVEEINKLGRTEMWNDMSPIWLRPQRLGIRLYKPRKLLQVVGHTPMDEITREKNLISSDVFSTYWDGRPIGTQEFLLLDTETWEYVGVKC